jgi:dTDP-4-amino-4,6-dideoxygalactose transaminase
VVELGYNYRLDEIRRLGAGQLSKLDRNNAAAGSGSLPRVFAGANPSNHLPSRHPGFICPSHAHIAAPGQSRQFHGKYEVEEIRTSIHYPPIHKFTAYHSSDRTNDDLLPVTEDVSAREVTLPLYPMLAEDDVITIVQAIRAALVQHN